MDIAGARWVPSRSKGWVGEGGEGLSSKLPQMDRLSHGFWCLARDYQHFTSSVEMKEMRKFCARTTTFNLILQGLECITCHSVQKCALQSSVLFHLGPFAKLLGDYFLQGRNYSLRA
uniref:Uncharacterized protein n=1 Tax=Trieres chinensis TaxID=1514140 RepID=A0A6U1T8M5_TRICV|mmetsp:Transcript_13183/g.27236  ORF Transcript_13183/g.27236 Transcript_13183/m.27236 type:complete len:117 (+) Transcript_13183:80-430(+)